MRAVTGRRVALLALAAFVLASDATPVSLANLQAGFGQAFSSLPPRPAAPSRPSSPNSTTSRAA